MRWIRGQVFPPGRAAASDPKYAKDRRDAFFNVARVYHSSKRYNEAKGASKEYLGAYPSDIQAMAALAGLYLRDEKRDSALSLYGAIVAHADSASAEDLFGAASTVLGVIPPSPDTADMDAACARPKEEEPRADPRQISARCQPAAVDSMKKYHALADPQYRLVAQTYEAGLAKNPYIATRSNNLAGISYLVGDRAKCCRSPAAVCRGPDEPALAGQDCGGVAAPGEEGLRAPLSRAGGLAPRRGHRGQLHHDRAGRRPRGLISNFHSKPSATPQAHISSSWSKGNVVASVPQEVPAWMLCQSILQIEVDFAWNRCWRYKRS